jgi:hypothetical protein
MRDRIEELSITLNFFLLKLIFHEINYDCKLIRNTDQICENTKLLIDRALLGIYFVSEKAAFRTPIFSHWIYFLSLVNLSYFVLLKVNSFSALLYQTVVGIALHVLPWSALQFLKRGFFILFIFYVRYSTLLHLPPLRFHCVGGYWDQTQDSCDYGIYCQTL